jgi:hypothetical protein
MCSRGRLRQRTHTQPIRAFRVELHPKLLQRAKKGATL